jgi:hypothetical protein
MVRFKPTADAALGDYRMGKVTADLVRCFHKELGSSISVRTSKEYLRVASTKKDKVMKDHGGSEGILTVARTQTLEPLKRCRRCVIHTLLATSLHFRSDVFHRWAEEVPELAPLLRIERIQEFRLGGIP